MTRRTGLLAAVGVLLSGCSGTAALNTLVADNTYDVQADVAYGPDPRQRLDVYSPKTPDAGGKGWPVVVFFYGGNWSNGERGDYKFLGESLASGGVLTVVADYRLSPQYKYPVFVQDSAAAVAWTLREAGRLGGDLQRVFVMGHSAGAYNAAMVALDARWLAAHKAAPSQLAGWIGLAGPYDFLPIVDPQTRVAFEWPNTQPDTQPIRYVTARSPRTLLLAAEKDKLVDPDRNTGGMAARLQAAGVPVRAERYSSVSHVTIAAAMARPLSFLAPVRQEVLSFVGAPGAVK